MSVEITTAFVEQYGANIDILSQQKESRLMRAVRNEDQTGESGFYEQVGPSAIQRATSRHDDTPRMDTPHARRKVSLVTGRWADLIDSADKVRMLIDPTSSYVKTAVMSFNRDRDQEIIDAALGTAYTGKTGSTAVTLPASQQVAVGATGLTIAKLRAGKRILDQNEVDEDIKRFWLTNALGIEDLLATTEVTSADYNTVKALVQGEIDTFMGFEFIRSEFVGVDGSGDYRNIAWAEDGLLLAKGTGGVVTRVTERADKNYSVQVFREETYGATRMEEKKVVEILCNP